MKVRDYQHYRRSVAKPSRGSKRKQSLQPLSKVYSFSSDVLFRAEPRFNATVRRRLKRFRNAYTTPRGRSPNNLCWVKASPPFDRPLLLANICSAPYDLVRAEAVGVVAHEQAEVGRPSRDHRTIKPAYYRGGGFLATQSLAGLPG